MELRLYDRAGPPLIEPRRWLRLPGWWVRVLEEFEGWAAPAPEPEADEEPSFAPVALLLGLALAAQYAQLWIPPVRAFLEERDILYRASWAGFTVLKHAALLVLVLVALRIREQPLASIGFPRLDARRLALAIALVGFFLGAALVHRSEYLVTEGAQHWMVPLWPEERLLWVLLAFSAAVVEETFFRGFALVWTYRWSRHLPLAVLLPAAVFAAGHGYLGWANVVLAFAASLVFSLVFLWRRDLYWLMVLHFLIDALILLA